MRWERLFADIEQQVADEDLLERDALVADLVAEEHARTSWRDRLGERARLRVQGAGVVEGQVLGARPALLHLRTAGSDVLVATDAVLTVQGPGRRREPDTSVTQRLGWASAWRVLRDESADVVVVLVDGSRASGTVVRVGEDHVELVAENGAVELVTYRGIATVTARG